MPAAATGVRLAGVSKLEGGKFEVPAIATGSVCLDIVCLCLVLITSISLIGTLEASTTVTPAGVKPSTADETKYLTSSVVIEGFPSSSMGL